MEAEPTPQMSPMDIIVNNLSKTIKKETEESPSIELNEQTVINMQKQIIDLRRMINEALGGRNMVSGIGQGGDGQSPGSGEVEVNLMDDVEVGPHASELQDGDVLVWDSSGRNGMGCWRPGKLNPSPSECLSIDGGESNNNFFDGQYPNRLDGSTASGSTQTESNYDTGNSSTTVCAGTISSDDQLFTAIDQLKVRLAEVESYVSVAVE